MCALYSIVNRLWRVSCKTRRTVRRKNLDSDEAYTALFRFYELNTLRQATDCLTDIFNLLKDEGNVAITCFEINVNYCHRGCISDSMRREYSLPTVIDL